MPANKKEYKRLPGSGVRRDGVAVVSVTRSKLYLGEDHLLSVDTIFYSETYRRFFFKDIQAITIRKTIGGMIANCIFAAFFGLLATPAFFVSGGERIGWLIAAGIFLVLLLGNTLRGTTCICHIKTAVQSEQLPTLSRLPRARKVLARLQPLIAQAQGGELSPEEASARMRELAMPPREQPLFTSPTVSEQPAFTEPPAEPPPAAI
jgi:hypothetical protein